jgi:ParB family chromosome partitioning protein
MTDTNIAKISEWQTALDNITDIHDARRMLSLAQGLVTTARKEYKATERAIEVKEDRDKAYDTAVKAGELRLLAEAKLGELIKNNELPPKRDETGKFTHKETDLPMDIGLSEWDTKQAKRIAENKHLIPNVVAKAKENGDIPTRQMMENMIKGDPHISYNSGENEWYTPQKYIDLAFEVMGNIDLDPASTEEANRVIQASKYFNKDQDGLKQEWYGRVWMNPPYAQPLIEDFCKKLISEIKSKNTTEAIVLVNNATETQWFQNLCQLAQSICFPKGRVKFWSPTSISAPLQGQVIIYFGDNKDKFAKVFKVKGVLANVQ